MTTALSLERLFERYQALLPLPPFTQKSLDEHFALLFTYHSNVLTGNGLTQIDTRVLLIHGLTAGGKRFTDHYDMVTHYEAVAFLMDAVKREEPLSVKLIGEIHKRALRGAEDAVTPGRFRPSNDNALSPSEDLAQRVANVLETYHAELKRTDDKLPTIAKLHCELLRLHPFVDGNGRLARLVLNFELLKAGFPMVLFKVATHDRYREALEAATEGNTEPFLHYVKAQLVETLTYIVELMDPEWLEAQGSTSEV